MVNVKLLIFANCKRPKPILKAKVKILWCYQEEKNKYNRTVSELISEVEQGSKVSSENTKIVNFYHRIYTDCREVLLRWN